VGVIDAELEVDEIGQRMRETRRRKVVADLPALTRGPHQSAAAKAREVVGHVRPSDAELVGEVGRVGGTVEQHQQDASASRVGQRRAHSLERLDRSRFNVAHATQRYRIS